jgi:hypothetical protein
MAADPPETRVLKIVSSGLQKASEETVKKYGEDLLKTVLPALVSAAVAGPLAAAAAAAVAATVESVLKQTTATERKLNRLLAAPFRTAAQTVHEVLSETARTPAEEAHANSRLCGALDALQTAYAYAESESPDKLLLIKVYQAFVSALVEGGGASMRRHLSDLRRLATSAEDEAKECDEERKRVQSWDPEYVEKIRLQHNKMAEWPASRLYIGLRLESIAEDFRKRAEFSRQHADAVRRFASLLEAVNSKRTEILRAPKEYPLAE